MKTTLPLLAVILLLCLSLCSCGKTDTPPQTGTMVVNPMQEKTALAEVNSAIGCSIHTPAGFSPADEKFFVISGTIGEYRFTVDGISYTLRASATKDDISGVYVDGKSLGEAADSTENGASDTILFEGGMWTRWFDGDMQYSLLSDETGAKDTAALYRMRDALR